MNLWWVRRDLRLEDNPALHAALKEGRGALPVFILDDALLAKPAEKRQAFLFGSLRSLDEDLRKRGSRLVVRRGDPAEEIPRLAKEVGAGSVYAEEDVSPYARRRDAAVGRMVDLHLLHGVSLHPAGAVAKADGGAYTVFTPYSRAWKGLPFRPGWLPAPKELPPVPELVSEMIPETPGLEAFPPGEGEARRRLAAFLDGRIEGYAQGRDRMDWEGTSALSPYLRFGLISMRRVVSAVEEKRRDRTDARSREGCEAFLNELIWREFYQSILFHFPNVLEEAFNPRLRAVAWRDAPLELEAWKNGMTGYPVVDAGMRQLAATGWMHNRARMIAASFLVKHLLIDWREGERWFMRQLVDGDPAANNGGWQWVAGTGASAAPYFRIFNPVIQGKRFDPEGEYVRRWVAELRDVDTKFVHTPWLTAGKVSYPAPLVELEVGRRRALEGYGF